MASPIAAHPIRSVLRTRIFHFMEKQQPPLPTIDEAGAPYTVPEARDLEACLATLSARFSSSPRQLRQHFSLHGHGDQFTCKPSKRRSPIDGGLAIVLENFHEPLREIRYQMWDFFAGALEERLKEFAYAVALLKELSALIEQVEQLVGEVCEAKIEEPDIFHPYSRLETSMMAKLHGVKKTCQNMLEKVQDVREKIETEMLEQNKKRFLPELPPKDCTTYSQEELMVDLLGKDVATLLRV